MNSGTAARAETAIFAADGRLPRPQPVGLHAFPASHLLLPASAAAGADEARAALLAGDRQGPVPDDWEFFLSESVQDVAGHDPVARYNRFVLAPSADGFASLASEKEPLRSLALAAAFAAGLVDDLPDPPLEDQRLDGELLGLVLMTGAAARIEAGAAAAAVALLTRAVTAALGPAPVLAALAARDLAELLLIMDPPDVAAAIGQLRQAAALAERGRLPLLAAEVWMRLGMALQSAAAATGDSATLVEAVRAYQRAVRSGITRESHPLWFARVQNNLGLAHLALPKRPVGDALRLAIAAHAFREASCVLLDEAADAFGRRRVIPTPGEE
jgi:hypothetical protein